MKKIDIEGLIPAIVIPFTEDYKVDEETLKNYLQIILKTKIKAIAVNTDAGEAHHLPKEEKIKILKITKEIVKDKIPIVSGISGINTFDAVEFGKQLKNNGADIFMVFPIIPFRGVKCKDKVIIEYHYQISKIGLPLILFQLQEELGGTEYPHETLEELVKIDNVIGIKDATFNAMKFKETAWFLKSLEKKITILTGNDNFIPESFLLGADGALIGFGAIFTDIQVEMIEDMKKGRYTEGMEKFKKIENICRICFAPPVRDYRARIKQVLVYQKIFKNSIVMPPLLPISEEEKKIIKKELEKIDYKV